MRVNGYPVVTGRIRFGAPSPNHAPCRDGAPSFEDVHRRVMARAQTIVDGFRFAIATAQTQGERERVETDYRDACTVLGIEPEMVGWVPGGGER